MSRRSTRATASDRAAEQARLAGALLGDLGESLDSFGALIALLEGEAPAAEGGGAGLSRLREACDRMRRLVGDLGEEVQGRSPSPEVDFDAAALARAACEAWIATAPALRASLRCEVPPGVRVHGRATLFSRVLENLLRHAERSASAEVRVRLVAEPLSGTPGLRLVVDDDGGAGAEEGAGIAVAHWAASRLGGQLSLRRCEDAGGTCRSLWLPLARPLPGRGRAASPLAGRVVVVADASDGRRTRLARCLRREGARPIELSPQYLWTVDGLAATIATTDAEVALLQVQLGTLSGLAVLEALGRIAPEMVDRVLLLSGAEDEDAKPAGGGRGGWAALRHAIVEHLAGTPDAL